MVSCDYNGMTYPDKQPCYKGLWQRAIEVKYLLIPGRDILHESINYDIVIQSNSGI